MAHHTSIHLILSQWWHIHLVIIQETLLPHMRHRTALMRPPILCYFKAAALLAERGLMKAIRMVYGMIFYKKGLRKTAACCSKYLHVSWRKRITWHCLISLDLHNDVDLSDIIPNSLTNSHIFFLHIRPRKKLHFKDIAFKSKDLVKLVAVQRHYPAIASYTKARQVWSC